MCNIELKEDISDLMRDTMIWVFFSGDINPLGCISGVTKKLENQFLIFYFIRILNAC